MQRKGLSLNLGTKRCKGVMRDKICPLFSFVQADQLKGEGWFALSAHVR